MLRLQGFVFAEVRLVGCLFVVRFGAERGSEMPHRVLIHWGAHKGGGGGMCNRYFRGLGIRMLVNDAMRCDAIDGHTLLKVHT